MKVSLLTDTVEVAIGAVPKSEARQSLSELLKLPRARRTAEQLKLIADHLYSFGMCASHSTARSPRRCKPASIAGPLPRPCRCFSSAHAGPCGACMPCGAAGPCAGGGMQHVTIARPILCRMHHLPAEVRAQVAAVALLTVYPPSSIVSTDKQACTVTLLASPRLHSTPHTGAHARAHTQLKTTAPPLRPVHSRYALSASPPTCTAQRRPGGMAYSGAQAKYAHFVLSGQCLALALGKPVRDKPCRPRIVGSFQFGELIPELPADILQEPPPPPLSPSLHTRTRTQRRTCPQLLGRAFLWTNSDFGDGHFWRLRDAVAASG